MKILKKPAMNFYKFILPLIFPLFFNNASAMFPEFNGWKLNVGEKVYVPDNLWDMINGAADAYLTYDFQKLYTAEYSNDNDKLIRVYIFEHSSPVNAFGIYSQERSTDYEFTGTGAQGFRSAESYYFITGPYYVQITGNSAENRDEIGQLATLINDHLKQNNQLPPELEFFPEEGKIPYSEKYIATSFLGYGFLRSAFVSSYSAEEKNFQIFIISPEEEQQTDKILTEYLDFVKFPKENRGQAEYIIEDQYNGQVYLYKAGKYLCGIMGAGQETSENYLNLLKEKIR